MISYPIDCSGQTIILSDPVLAHFDHHRQLQANSREAGGQLFARFDGKVVRVERATGPRPSDRRSPTSFVPDRKAERREIRKNFRAGLHYVGDWHTHLEPRPSPSQTDIDSFRDMYRKSSHRLASFLMVIVGTSLEMDGLYVALCDGHLLRQLNESVSA